MTTKRRVLLDGNGSSQINVEGLGVYVPAIEHDHLMQKLGAEIQQLKDQLEEVKAMFVDAIGDGWYAGFLACKNRLNDESFDIDAVGGSYIFQESERFESEHRYAKSINDIRAKAICDFKDELLAATSVIFRPHIEGVCAVVTERMQAAKGGE